jgi:adenine C2-methylase RlmN of 23S rRNA A2503 and tRNA A37
MRDNMRVLNSQQDKSVNFIEEQLVGFLESRYVRKCDEYFVAYLSSQTGCNRGCSFCHLTTTGQTSFTDTTYNEFTRQASNVFAHYKREQKPAQYMHYSFMARGEPLACSTIVDASTALFQRLGDMALSEGLPAKFNLSTIIPLTLKRSLVEIFPYITPTIYYSMYSVNEEWRKKWMPGAMVVTEALRLLKEYQDFSKKIVKIHFPLIEGENDSNEDIHSLCDRLDEAELICEFNLVRYNPASAAQGKESSGTRIGGVMDIMHRRFKGKVQEIPRVGFDVKASCGMFAGEEEPTVMASLATQALVKSLTRNLPRTPDKPLSGEPIDFAQLPECTHGLEFDEEEANTYNYTRYEIRQKWPRLDGKCEKCGYEGIAYASMAHFIYGDW